MKEDLYRCSCGRGFRTAQGLAGHKRFCRKALQQPRAEESVGELLHRFSGLEEKYEALSQLCAGSLKRLSKLEGMVNELVQFVRPTGNNMVGVNSSRIMAVSAQFHALKSEMDTSQETLEREIKGWVWNVIPERFRPRP